MKKQIFDTHCHYNLEPLSDNWESHWKKAQKHGVSHTVIVGTSLESSKRAAQQAKNHANLFHSNGIHPSEAQNAHSIQEDAKNLELHIKKSPGVAIGEIGLDYYRLSSSSDPKKIIAEQKKLLRLELELAEQCNLPIILHVRDKETPAQKTANNAYWDMISILEKHYSGKKPFVLHCASGPLSYVLHALDMGAYLGFDGNITYPSANYIRDILKNTPFSRVLVETDAPYLPPQDYRGKICEPWMISLTEKYLTEEFGITVDITTENAITFFGLGDLP